MIRVKKALAVLSALTVLMYTGCSKNTLGNESLKGGYVENVVKIEGINSIADLYNLNGNIVAYDSENAELVTVSGDNESFVDKLNGYDDSCIYAVNDDVSFLGIFDEKLDDYMYIIVKSDGSETPVKITNNQYVSRVDISDEGKVYAVIDNMLCEISSDDGSVTNIENVGYMVSAFDVVGDCIYYYDEYFLHIYDTIKEESLEVPTILNTLFTSDDINPENIYKICQGDENSIIIGCAEGIYRYVIGKEYIEQLVDGASSSVGNRVKKFKSLEYTNDGAIVVGFDDGEICSYVYDPDYSTEKTSTLTIYSLDNNEELKQIINNYASDNQNVKIIYKTGHRNGMTYGDALKEFSVMMLSADIPDIIVTDGLDIDNLIEKNTLMELSQYEEVWDKEDKLLDNVAKWSQREDRIYCVTSRFRIPAISAENEMLKEIKSFSDAVDCIETYSNRINGKYSVSSIGAPQSIVRLGLGYEGVALISNNEIDESKLKIFFDDCKRYFKCEQKSEYMAKSGHFALQPSEYSFASAFSNNIANEYTIALGTINTFEKDLNYVTSLETSKNSFDIDYRFGITDNSRVFIPNCTFAIAEKSKNKDEALKFLSSVLSKEFQIDTCGNGFPVNIDTLDWYCNSKKRDSDIYVDVLMDYDMNFVDEVREEAMNDMEIKSFKSYIEKLDQPFVMNHSVIEIIEDNAIKCMYDQISSQEAVNEVKRQLDLKIKE